MINELFLYSYWAHLNSFHFPLGYGISYKILGNSKQNIPRSHSWTFCLNHPENHMVDSTRSCRWLHSLKVPELVCVLWLPVINPSRVTVNLAFSGGGGHGPPQLLLLPLLLEPSNSGVYPDTDRDRVGRSETHNPKLPSSFVPYPIL